VHGAGQERASRCHGRVSRPGGRELPRVLHTLQAPDPRHTQIVPVVSGRLQKDLRREAQADRRIGGEDEHRSGEAHRGHPVGQRAEQGAAGEGEGLGGRERQG